MFSRTARVLTGAGVLALATMLGLAGVQAASAAPTAPMNSGIGEGGCGGGAEILFQANYTNLWAVGEDQRGDLGLGMAAGTSPAITCLTGGGWEAAFQANTGDLWTVGQDSHGNWGAAMKAGTSPAITALPGGGYEVAFQGSNGDMWTAGPGGVTDSGLPMMAGTSPAITALNGGGYEYAAQGSNGYLWVGSYDGPPFYQNLAMKAGTSPSMTVLPSGTVEIAFQESNNCLDIIGASLSRCVASIRAGSSPSVTAFPDPNNPIVVAFQDLYTGKLDTYMPGAGVYDGYSLQIMNGTSPSITTLPGGTWEIEVQGTNTDLWTQTNGAAPYDWGLGMMTGTSPSISS